MKKLLQCAALLICLLVAQLTASSASAETVTGVVQDRNWLGIRGLSVYLVNAEIGRSYPKLTDNDGRFHFSSVPLSGAPYYLEIYWGDDLVYRKSMWVEGDLVLRPIILG